MDTEKDTRDALDDHTDGVHGEGAVPASSTPANPETGADTTPENVEETDSREAEGGEDRVAEPGSDQPNHDEPENA